MTTELQNILAPIEDFLTTNSESIPAPYRAIIRENAIKSITGKTEIINLDHCPARLRVILLDLILDAVEARRKMVQEEYIERCRANNEEFNPKQKYMLLDGQPYAKTVNQAKY